MKKIAVVLSGCGYKDGSEITEAVSTLIALSETGSQYQCFSLDKDYESVDHINGQSTGKRNVLTDSARISRGQISNIQDLKCDNFDAVIFPGGFGAALHLCNWAEKGANCKVEPDVERVITEFFKAEKPIGAICIAPVLLAKVLGHHEITLTIGQDKETALEIEKTQAIHEDCPVEDYVSDRAHRLVTTPAYMYDEAKPNQVFQGVSGLVREIVEMA